VLGMLLAGGGLLGAVLFGLVVLPGTHGLATVAEVPLGCDVVPVAVVVEVEPMPLLLVVLPIPVVEELVLLDGVVPAAVVVEVVPLGLEVELLGVTVLVPLLDGVHGATVVCVAG
jgi:hypothetical protein